jgi:hypothetical protein
MGPGSHGHFQDVEATGAPVDGVHDPALVDEDVVEPDGAGPRHDDSAERPTVIS